MKRFLVAGLLTTLILFPMFGYVYVQGMMDGVVRYRASKSFELTLRSMYAFGVKDACTIPGWCAAVLGEPKK